jgi:hypothetical protein
MCNTYCFPTATMVARTQLDATLQYTVCLLVIFSRQVMWPCLISGHGYFFPRNSQCNINYEPAFRHTLNYSCRRYAHYKHCFEKHTMDGVHRNYDTLRTTILIPVFRNQSTRNSGINKYRTHKLCNTTRNSKYPSNTGKLFQSVCLTI